MRITNLLMTQIFQFVYKKLENPASCLMELQLLRLSNPYVELCTANHLPSFLC
jgi:hypothetical protein